MRTLVEITQERDNPDEDSDETLYETSKWWLHHWGLEYKFVEVEEKMVPVSFTVAICENYETGKIQTFLPEQLKIIGKEI